MKCAFVTSARCLVSVAAEAKADKFGLDSQAQETREMQAVMRSDPLVDKVSSELVDFSRWLSMYGEKSLDYQTFYAGRIGSFAKSLYYRHRRLGIAAVAPMVFCEALIPSARRLFYHRVRFPIADAHFAMGFGCKGRSIF
jgi:hypothetical protein